ncbi:MAG: 3-isopropylmalate dehydratase small subunit [Deltaproteobacteria bacterium]|nr:3-isopropylmalate dehydratase small subunit [Deltaproteobacteria bacterium]
MKLKGTVWKFGDHIDTDLIIPARFLNVSDKEELAKSCFADARPDFAKNAKSGGIIVAGENFGCGSSREHAPIAIKAAGIECVIAASFARIFYRNAFNIGLPILEASVADDFVEEGDRVSVDLVSGEIRNETKGKAVQTMPLPPFMRKMVECGGLVPYIKQKSVNSKEG